MILTNYRYFFYVSHLIYGKKNLLYQRNRGSPLIFENNSYKGNGPFIGREYNHFTYFRTETKIKNFKAKVPLLS